jgi:3-mercaptopyruvate sulfurtransferase SseA
VNINIKGQMMKVSKLISILASVSVTVSMAENMKVQITEDVAYVMTKDSGEAVRVQRIQDPNYRLTDDYTKTSRSCPPFCIQETKVDKDIKNIAELELLTFMKNQVKNNEGLIVDARLSSWYETETIPSAISIPFTKMQKASPKEVEGIFKTLGMKVKKDSTWDFSKVKELAIFCNGVWCEQSKHLVVELVKYNYPKEKLSYYRSGFQGWKLLGLTTIVHKEIK